MKWFAGADHAGYQLKDVLVAVLRGLGDEVEDLGTHSGDSVDYPDFGSKVARAVADHPGSFGLLVCGTGIGIGMAACKVSGIRAATVTNEFTARAARAHNDANIIAMGQRVTGAGVAQAAVRAFRDTAFEGGRHERRVSKINAMD